MAIFCATGKQPFCRDVFTVHHCSQEWQYDIQTLSKKKGRYWVERRRGLNGSSHDY